MMPPATAHRSRTLRRGPAPRASRRISGPTRPPRAALAGSAGAAVARPPLSMRLGRRAMRVGDARVLDRLVRGRAWIAIVAAALIGIVFMQVSMLRLNAGVSRAVTAADTLERQNSTLRADISKLDSGERVQDAAANLGMVTRAAGDVHYLDGAAANPARASASIKPPNPVAPVAPALGAAATSGAGAAANGAAANGAAPTGTAAAAPMSGAGATGAAATSAAAGAGATGAAAGNGTTGPAATTGAPNSATTPATTNGAAAPISTPAATQQGAAATTTAPPATGTAPPGGTVAGGATAAPATPGEG